MPFTARSECCWGFRSEEGCGTVFLLSSERLSLDRCLEGGGGEDGTGQGSIKQFGEFHNFFGTCTWHGVTCKPIGKQ